MNTAVWIVIAVVVVLLIVAIAVALSKKSKQKRVEKAGEIRERAAERSAHVEHSEALAQKSEADARRAQAEADAKAAEAKLAQQRAHEHQGAAAGQRDELDREWERANKLDPTVHDDGTPRGGDRAATDGRDAGRQEQVRQDLPGHHDQVRQDQVRQDQVRQDPQGRHER